MILIERIRAALRPAAPAMPRPAPARVTTRAERAPLYAAYAAARSHAAQHRYRDWDDTMILLAVEAYEKTLSGGSCVAPISDRLDVLHGDKPIDLLSDSWKYGTGHPTHVAYRQHLAPTGGPDVTLPREVANRIENLLIAVERTHGDTGTVVNALRRILSDAIDETDHNTWLKTPPPDGRPHLEHP